MTDVKRTFYIAKPHVVCMMVVGGWFGLREGRWGGGGLREASFLVGIWLCLGNIFNQRSLAFDILYRFERLRLTIACSRALRLLAVFLS